MDDSQEDQLSQARLETIKTHCIIPVDLNCLLLRVEEGLARAHELVASLEKSSTAKLPRKETGAQIYDDAAAARRKAIDEVLWNDADKCYNDYRLDKGRLSKVVALSNWAAPLWAGLHGPQDTAAAMVESN